MKTNTLKLSLGALFLTLPHWALAGGGINALEGAFNLIILIIFVLALLVPPFIGSIVTALIKENKRRVFLQTLLIGYGIIALLALVYFSV